MKNIKQILLILGVALVGLASCQKKDLDTETIDQQYSMLGATCSHDSMIHYSAVQPNDTSFGWVEHYYCPDCGGYFADPDGKQPLENVIIWGSSLNLNSTEEYMSIFSETYDYITSNPDAYGEENAWISGAAILDLLKNAALNELGEVLKKLLDVYHKATGPKPAPTVNDYLKQIMDQLGNIESAINAVSSTIKKLDEKNMMVERERNVFYMANATHPAFRAVLDQLEGVSDTSQVTADKKIKIQNIVDGWYNKGIYNGVSYDNCYVKICDLMHFFNGYVASKSFPQMYDEVVFASTPWKHEQEMSKFMIRIDDMMNLTEAYFMMTLYLYFHPDNTSAEKLKLLTTELQAYHKVIDANPVPLHEKNFREWMWRDASGNTHLHEYYLNQKLYDYPMNHITYYIYENKHLEWHKESTVRPLLNIARTSNDNIAIFSGEGYVIFNYYYNSHFMTNFYEMLIKAGFENVVPFSKNGRIVFRDNAPYKYTQGDPDFKMECGEIRFHGNPGPMYFSNVVDGDGFKLLNYGAETIFQAGVRWGVDWKKANEIQDPGKSTDNVFQSITFQNSRRR